MSKRLSALPALPSLALIIALCALLGACASGPIKTGTAEMANELERAESKPTDALAYAQRYRNEIGQRGLQHSLLLQAEAELALEDDQALRQTLAKIDENALSRDDHMRLRCVRSLAALRWESAPAAVKQLPNNDPSAPDALQRRVLRTQVKVLWSAGYKIDALRAQLSLLDLTQGDEHEQLASSALQRMGALPERSLEHIQQRQLSPALNQWSAFILATKPQLFDLEGYDSAVALWQSRYPQNNVPQELIERLRKGIAKRSQYPESVALLLPLSGAFSEQARSVRDGFLGAYYASQRDELPHVHILDTQGSEAGVHAAVDEALEKEAQIIVGPLLKSSIEQLATRRDIRVPVLALNRLAEQELGDKQLRSPLFQFGLMPEDEGVQAARMAIVRNQVNALLLLPDNALGRRLGDAFSTEFATFGGTLLATEYYDPDAADYGSAVKSALNTRQSESRLSILQTVLRRRVGFDARRRQDIDVIYLVAQPSQARSIKPLLKFHDAGKVPVLANSMLYTGVENPRLNRDIDGVTFTIMPWEIQGEETPLHQQVNALWPRDAARYSSLFALGADAFKLIPHLGTMASNPQYHTGGYTGHLSADEQGIIHRELMWAEYNEGRVEMVENDLLDLMPIENVGTENADDPVLMDETKSDENTEKPKAAAGQL